MILRNRFFRVTLSLLVLGFASRGLACVPELRGRQSTLLTIENGDLCAVADRILKVRQELQARGVNPDRIAEVRAPRFILMSDWEKQINGGLFRAPSYDPRFMYDLKNQKRGSVWGGWDQTATQIDDWAQNRAALAALGIKDPFVLDIRWMMRIQLLSLSIAEPEVVGHLRKEDSVAAEFYRQSAPSLDEIRRTTLVSYPTLADSRVGLVTWKNTPCYEDLSAAVQSKISRREMPFSFIKGDGKVFRDPRDPAIWRKCGFYVYSDPSEIPGQLKILSREVTTQMEHLTQDPIRLAAHAQRFYVSIHPFDGGNGRTSRFLMDLILQSYGLPTPILRSMNKDMTMSESEWSLHVAQGLERTIRTLEKCASQTPTTCHQVPY